MPSLLRVVGVVLGLVAIGLAIWLGRRGGNRALVLPLAAAGVGLLTAALFPDIVRWLQDQLGLGAETSGGIITALILATTFSYVIGFYALAKAERFARALLEAAHPRLAAVPIVGREPGRAVAKPETLLRLAEAHALRNDGADLWFVEDLLETLEAMAATPRLGRARLFLAAWGYNTLEQRAAAAMRPRLAVLSLAGFAEPFARWPS